MPAASSAASAPIAVVVGVLQDIHHLGLKVLSYALQEAGFRVVDVGAGASQEEFIGAAIETNARAILVSSSNGLAEIDCRGMRAKCIEAGLGEVVLYAGGNLVVSQQARAWSEVERVFREMGFTRAYSQGVHPANVVADLRADLGLPGAATEPS